MNDSAAVVLLAALIWIGVSAGVSYAIAKSRGLNPVGYAWLGALIPIVGILAAGLMAPPAEPYKPSEREPFMTRLRNVGLLPPQKKAQP